MCRWEKSSLLCAKFFLQLIALSFAGQVQPKPQDWWCLQIFRQMLAGRYIGRAELRLWFWHAALLRGKMKRRWDVHAERWSLQPLQWLLWCFELDDSIDLNQRAEGRKVYAHYTIETLTENIKSYKILGLWNCGILIHSATNHRAVIFFLTDKQS